MLATSFCFRRRRIASQNAFNGVRLIRRRVSSAFLFLCLTVNYWHPFELRRPMREIAAFYPKTYQKVGAAIADLGYDVLNTSSYSFSSDELQNMFLAILAAMPPHVKPYRSMGDETTWGDCDWTCLFQNLSK